MGALVGDLFVYVVHTASETLWFVHTVIELRLVIAVRKTHSKKRIENSALLQYTKALLNRK